jgi:hypothetical protein
MANVAVFVPKPIVDPETGEALGPGCLALLASRVCTCAKEAPAGVDGVQLAAKNKCLAQSNKSRMGGGSDEEVKPPEAGIRALKRRRGSR